MTSLALRTTIFWFLGLAIVVVVLVFMVMGSRPSEAEVAAAVRPLSPLPTEVLTEQTLQTLTRRELHGPVPVEALPADPPRSDPFL